MQHLIYPPSTELSLHPLPNSLQPCRKPTDRATHYKQSRWNLYGFSPFSAENEVFAAMQMGVNDSLVVGPPLHQQAGSQITRVPTAAPGTLCTDHACSQKCKMNFFRTNYFGRLSDSVMVSAYWRLWLHSRPLVAVATASCNRQRLSSKLQPSLQKTFRHMGLFFPHGLKGQGGEGGNGLASSSRPPKGAERERGMFTLVDVMAMALQLEQTVHRWQSPGSIA